MGLIRDTPGSAYNFAFLINGLAPTGRRSGGTCCKFIEAMPIYAYRCTSCGHAQDVLQKISDPVLTDCPACGAASYVKQLTAAGFQLKGSGWYVTDFRGGNATGKDAAREGAAGDAKDGAKPGTADTAKADTAAAGPAAASASAKPADAAKPAAAAPAPAPAPAAPKTGA